ncbi:MAG: tetratricopeptide repeat protein [Flavobacterium sp.]|uniref:tetratricopeptide repeat protein n=1 Tax=Flavobacterium sp. TaxID=239 RepID=UPI002638AD0F|nr:tetratricopeptide repeat protein [Flavobacterium sp.]MDD5150123.1 tetratricopeptide repeat protein [Flavobacterium sp.]
MKFNMTICLIMSFLIVGCGNSQKKDNVGNYESKLNSPTKNDEAAKYYNDGYAEFQKENYEKAIKNYKKAIQLDSSYTDAIDNCALSYRRLNQLDSAEYYYKLSLKKLPTNELAMSNLGLVYMFKNDFKTAKSTFKKLLKTNPNYGDGLYSLSEVYLRENKNDSAIIYSSKAYEVWKDNNPEFSADALYYTGLAYLQKGDKKKAMDFFIRANKLGKNIPPEIQKQLK